MTRLSLVVLMVDKYIQLRMASAFNFSTVKGEVLRPWR